MALAAALLGWMFDGAEMGIFSLVGRSAVMDLLETKDESVIGLWFNVVIACFLVGAATGGVLFGWLGDRIGRVRAMTLSVLTYALFTGLCGFAGTAWQIGILRFIAALGMGGEWSLGVALVMEVWPNRSRAFMAGLIGAAANVGYLIVGIAGIGLNAILENLHGGLLSIGLPTETVEMLTAHQGWRIMMLLGTAPAFLTFLIRIFVPESEKWEKEQGSGHTSNWATHDLFGVLIGCAGPFLIVYLWAFGNTGDVAHSLVLRILGTLLGLAIATVGFTYPVLRYLQRLNELNNNAQPWQPVLRRMMLAACLSGVALLGTWGSTQQAPSWAHKLTEATNSKLAEGEPPIRNAKEHTQNCLAIGAVIGTIIAAFAGDAIGRRNAYCLLCALSLGSVLLFYVTNSGYGSWFLITAFLMGACTASFYGWLPLYLPELFNTNVRATGQGFGFNFGRVLAAIGTLQTGTLIGWFNEPTTLGPITVGAGHPAACSIISLIYLVGMVLIWFAPETKGKPLPD